MGVATNTWATPFCQGDFSSQDSVCADDGHTGDGHPRLFRQLPRGFHTVGKGFDARVVGVDPAPGPAAKRRSRSGHAAALPSKPDHLHIIPCCRQRNLALAQPHGIIAERLEPPAVQRGQVAFTGRNRIQISGRGNQF